jgi:hypothetical protein
MHFGNHTCIDKNPKINRSVMEAVVQDPGVTSNNLVNDYMVQAMKSVKFNWNELETTADAFVDIKRVQCTCGSYCQNNPFGHYFEALSKIKIKNVTRKIIILYIADTLAILMGSQHASISLAMPWQIWRCRWTETQTEWWVTNMHTLMLCTTVVVALRRLYPWLTTKYHKNLYASKS